MCSSAARPLTHSLTQSTCHAVADDNDDDDDDDDDDAQQVDSKPKQQQQQTPAGRRWKTQQ